MISYEEPPRLSAESILVGKRLKALAETAPPGAPTIDLVCASPGDEVASDPGLEELLPETLRVPRLDPVPQGRMTILQRIIGGKGGWQVAAVAKSAALFPAEHKKPALLYSRSHPPASHLAALDLVEGPLKGVPWVAHFSDPWSQHAYYKSRVTRAALGRYERRVFEAATRLVFVSQTLRDTMLGRADEATKAKSRVMPHLFDAALYNRAALPAALAAERPGLRKVAHVGDLYGLRSPEPLFAGLGQLLKSRGGEAPLALWLVGRLDPAFQGLDERFAVVSSLRYVPPVPYLESLAVMNAADVLLTVEAPVRSSIFFPSKLIDYLGARKPMFAITPKGGLTSRVMDLWKQPWCDVSDLGGIAAHLGRIANGDLWAPPDASVLDAYSAGAVARQLAAVFGEVMG